MDDGSANYTDGGWPPDTTYYTTVVGAYDAKPSVSAYGTFDQGGNVREWLETDPYRGDGSNRGTPGGSFITDIGDLHASRFPGEFTGPSGGDHFTGFRVASIPEPSALVLLVMGALCFGLYRWRAG